MLASFPKVPNTASKSHENRRFRLPHCRSTPPLQRTPANIRTNLMPQKVESMAYISAADSMGIYSFIFLWWAPKDASFLEQMRIGRSRSSKVFDFATNRKGACDFLLVINSNFGPSLHRFWDTASYWLKIADFSYHTLVWRPLGARGGNPSEFLDETYRSKTRGMGLLYGENCMILTSTVFDWSTRVTDGLTNGQTDGQTELP